MKWKSEAKERHGFEFIRVGMQAARCKDTRSNTSRQKQHHFTLGFQQVQVQSHFQPQSSARQPNFIINLN